MYIYDFLTSLDLLKKERIPLMDEFPKNAIYYGKCSKEELQKGNPTIIGEGDKYILYTVEHIDKLYAKCIDEQLAYIHELNQFDLMIPRSMMIYTDVAILEAIRLYDELSKHTDNPNPFFDMDMNIKMPVISSIYLNNYVNNHPSLYYFQNNPIKKELVSAQFIYFVKKYCEYRLTVKDHKVYKVRNIENTLHNAMVQYQTVDHDAYHILEITGLENKEFDDFIQQIMHVYEQNQNNESMKSLKHNC